MHTWSLLDLLNPGEGPVDTPVQVGKPTTANTEASCKAGSKSKLHSP